MDVPRTGEDLKRIKKLAREKSVEEIEKRFVQETLKRNDSNVTRSAAETGMQRTNFQALMKKYNIRVRDGEIVRLTNWYDISWVRKQLERTPAP